MKGRQKTFIILLAVLLLIFILLLIIVKNAGLVVKHKIEKTIGTGFSVENVEIKWRELKAVNPVLKKDDTTYFMAKSISLSLNMAGIIKREFKFSRIILTEPYLLIEVDREGKVINPLKLGDQGKKEQTPLREVSIGSLLIDKGSLDYSDGKISKPPHLTRIRDLEFRIKDLYIPLSDRMSLFNIEASILGNISIGKIRGNGSINLKTRDMVSKISISNIDVTAFKPYFEKKGDARITRGYLDINMDLTIRNGKIKAPGRAILRGLEFDASSTKDRFLGVPRHAVINLLKDSNGAISLDFVIEGDINNPRFNLRESLLEKMTIGLADKLGLSVTRIGESIIVEGARQIEKGISGVGRGIEKLFK